MVCELSERERETSLVRRGGNRESEMLPEMDQGSAGGRQRWAGFSC